MTKLQIALTDQEADFLTFQAVNLGYSLTRYVKFLIGQKAAAVSESIPTFRMSDKLEKNTKEAIAAQNQGKTYSVSSLQELYK